MSETSLFAELVKDRNRKEVEAKLAAAKEQKLTPSDIPMPSSASKVEEAPVLPVTEVVEVKPDEIQDSEPAKIETIINFPKLESPKFFEDIAKEMSLKEPNEGDEKRPASISERKSIEMDIEDTGGGGIIHVETDQPDCKIDKISNEISYYKSHFSSPMKSDSNDSKNDSGKKNTFTAFENFRKGSLGETLKIAAELSKKPQVNDKKIKKDNSKMKHGSLINKMPLPPGIKSTDLESIDSPPSRSPSPLPVAEKKKPKSIKSIKDLPLPPGNYSVFAALLCKCQSKIKRMMPMLTSS